MRSYAHANWAKIICREVSRLIRLLNSFSRIKEIEKRDGHYTADDDIPYQKDIFSWLTAQF